MFVGETGQDLALLYGWLRPKWFSVEPRQPISYRRLFMHPSIDAWKKHLTDLSKVPFNSFTCTALLSIGEKVSPRPCGEVYMSYHPRDEIARIPDGKRPVIFIWLCVCSFSNFFFTEEHRLYGQDFGCRP